MSGNKSNRYGPIAFIGSGETAQAGGRVYEILAEMLDSPIRVAVLETPAGFELNSAQVAGRVAEYIEKRLQNFRPLVDLVPARKKGTPFSPDDPQILTPLLTANMIFMGPGSPTYAVRQLQDSLAWDLIRARHAGGAAVIFASAAAVSAGKSALPVYEIFKVGEDVHAPPGLDLFGVFNAQISLVPHWNNSEGGADLDTSRCFVGKDRFEAWVRLLTGNQTVVGIDEHTGLIMSMEERSCTVLGVGTVTILSGGRERTFKAGDVFSFRELGDLVLPGVKDLGLQEIAWKLIEETRQVEEEDETIPGDVARLVEKRQLARENRDWSQADRLREQIAEKGWEILDTNDGPVVQKS